MRKTTEIRRAFAQKIEDLAYFTKVYSVRRTNISDNNLPAVTVTSGTGVYTDGMQNCSLAIRVEIKDKGSNIEDILDTHAEVIEPLFPIGAILGGLVEYVEPESFDYSLDDDSELGTMILDFNVKYGV